MADDEGTAVGLAIFGSWDNSTFRRSCVSASRCSCTSSGDRLGPSGPCRADDTGAATPSRASRTCTASSLPFPATPFAGFSTASSPLSFPWSTSCRYSPIERCDGVGEASPSPTPGVLRTAAPFPLTPSESYTGEAGDSEDVKRRRPPRMLSASSVCVSCRDCRRMDAMSLRSDRTAARRESDTASCSSICSGPAIRHTRQRGIRQCNMAAVGLPPRQPSRKWKSCR